MHFGKSVKNFLAMIHTMVGTATANSSHLWISWKAFFQGFNTRPGCNINFHTSMGTSAFQHLEAFDFIFCESFTIWWPIFYGLLGRFIRNDGDKMHLVLPLSLLSTSSLNVRNGYLLRYRFPNGILNAEQMIWSNFILNFSFTARTATNFHLWGVHMLQEMYRPLSRKTSRS